MALRNGQPFLVDRCRRRDDPGRRNLDQALSLCPRQLFRAALGGLFDGPDEGPKVFPKAGPEEGAIVIASKPVDVEEPRRVFARPLHQPKPVLEEGLFRVGVEAHHGHWICAEDDWGIDGGGGLHPHDRPIVDAGLAIG